MVTLINYENCDGDIDHENDNHDEYVCKADVGDDDSNENDQRVGC